MQGSMSRWNKGLHASTFGAPGKRTPCLWSPAWVQFLPTENIPQLHAASGVLSIGHHRKADLIDLTPFLHHTATHKPEDYESTTNQPTPVAKPRNNPTYLAQGGQLKFPCAQCYGSSRSELPALKYPQPPLSPPTAPSHIQQNTDLGLFIKWDTHRARGELRNPHKMRFLRRLIVICFFFLKTL